LPIIGSSPNKTFQRTDGTRTGAEVWQEAKVAAVKIRADAHDTHDEDIGDAISACLFKDGSNLNADIAMNSNKFTGVGSATARTHFAAASQVQDGSFNYVAAAGTGDAITLDLTPSITAYVTGAVYWFKATATNTGAATVNIDAVGAKDLKKGAAGSTALAAGDITSGGVYAIGYDGTNMQLLNPGTQNITITAAGAAILDDASASDQRTTLGVVTATEAAEGLVEMATDAEIYAATSGAKAVMAQDLSTAAAPVALTDAATVAVDWASGINFTLAIGGNRTLGNPTNGIAGTWRRIQITQDGTGSRTLAYGNQYVFAGGSEPVLTTTASAVDVLYIYCRTTSIFEVYVGGYAWAA
jgi:hypothetical protein